MSDQQLQERLEGRVKEVFNEKWQRKDKLWYRETLIFPLKQLGDTRWDLKEKLEI